MKIQRFAFMFRGNKDLCRPIWLAMLSLSMVLADTPSVSAQDGANGAPLIIQMYQVEDLVSRSVDQPFNGFVLPGIADDSVLGKGFGGGGNQGGFSGGGGSFGGGGGGYGGGGGGGGVFCIAPLPVGSASPQLGGGGGPVAVPYAYQSSHEGTTQDLISVLQRTVSPSSWRSDLSGAGTIESIGTILVVAQTPAVHQQIESFFQMLRGMRSVKRPTINIKAVWLTIDEAQLESLAPQANQAVDETVLKELVKEHGRRAQVTCYDGQTVHVVSGNLKSSVESVVPVVGQLDLESEQPTRVAQNQAKPAKLPKHVLAQVSSSVFDASSDFDVEKNQSGRQVGYAPVARWVNYGALLQVSPKVKTETEIELDLTSIVVMPGQQTPGWANGSFEVDRHNMHCQQFKTSARLNVGVPTLVGGSTFESEGNTSLQTYLIVTATPVTTD